MGTFRLPLSKQAPRWRFSLTSTGLLALALFSSVAAIANAQTTTPTSIASTTPEASVSTTTPTTTETTIPPVTTPQPPTTSAALNEAAQQRVINLAANISNQLEATITRLETISRRLETRINRIAETGVDVSTARTELAQTRTNLLTARRALETIDADVYAVATAANPRAEWESVKGTYQTAQAQIMAARDAAVRTITALRTN